MKVFIDEFGSESSSSMEVDSSDTVLEMKQKIKRRTGYSVSELAIFFKGEAIPEAKDNHTLQQCGIVQESHITFFRLVRLHQTHQSSNTEEEDTTNMQDSSLNENPAFQTGQGINDQDLAQPKWIVTIPGDFPARFGLSNLDLIQERLPPVNAVVNDPNLPVGNNNEPPQNLRVKISVYSHDFIHRREFAVDVKDSDNVEVLRTELAKIQGIYLPPGGGYYFYHQEKLLDDHQSFRTYNVANEDRIDILPGHVRH